MNIIIIIGLYVVSLGVMSVTGLFVLAFLTYLYNWNYSEGL